MDNGFDDVPGGSFVEEAAELKQLIHLIESSAGKADISVFKKAQEIVRRTSIVVTCLFTYFYALSFRNISSKKCWLSVILPMYHIHVTLLLLSPAS